MSAKVTLSPLAIDLIRCDGGTQMRAELSTDVYMDYRDKILAGVEFPPLDVFFDGSEYWLADGFHRFYGHREAKRASIKCNVHNGTVRDAILFAVGANDDHGLKRSPKDKRNSINTLLGDGEWGKRSTQWIAEHAKVSRALVEQVRKENDASQGVEKHPEPAKRIGKDGKAQSATQKKKPQASVTGGNVTHSAAPPKSLPTEGTVNQAEPGGQGAGDAGECLRGGEHDFLEGACIKCLEPEPVKNGPLDFDPATLDKQSAAAAAGQPDLTKLQHPYDVMLNAITQIKKLWNDVTSDERDGVYCAQKRQRVLTLLDELRPPIAQARPMKVCTFCEGKGCQKCSGCGWWPRSVVEGLSR